MMRQGQLPVSIKAGWQCIFYFFSHKLDSSQLAAQGPCRSSAWVDLEA
jgi:hypothetical protein